MATRDELIARARARLERYGLPRLTMLLALALAGGAAFLTAVMLLRGGLTTMALRYALAGLAGYLSFILIIRLWITFQRRSAALDAVDALDLLNVTGLPAPSNTGDAMSLAEGGSSGGAGASGPWGNAVEASAGEAASGALDVDEVSFLAVLGGVALAGLIGIAYVVYIAPLLLAEVALDAALVSTLYGRLRRQDMRHWAGTLVRRTWLPAAALIATLAIGGFVMQLAVPDAVSIGGVLAAMAD